MKTLKVMCLLAPLVGACGESQNMDQKSAACTPGALTSYDGAQFATNAATELDVKARFKAFLQPMKDAELNVSLKPTAAQLGQLLDAGTPSLRAQTSAGYAQPISGYLAEFEAAAGLKWQPGPTPMGPGGIYGKYIFNARGTDLRQIIEKGMFGAMFYHQAQTLLRGPLTPATVDRALALFGAPPSFPADDKATPSPDDLMAVSIADGKVHRDVSQGRQAPEPETSLDEHRARPVAGGGEGRGHAGDPPADDDDIMGSPDRERARGLMDDGGCGKRVFHLVVPREGAPAGRDGMREIPLRIKMPWPAGGALVAPCRPSIVQSSDAQLASHRARRGCRDVSGVRGGAGHR